MTAMQFYSDWPAMSVKRQPDAPAPVGTGKAIDPLWLRNQTLHNLSHYPLPNPFVISHFGFLSNENKHLYQQTLQNQWPNTSNLNCYNMKQNGGSEITSETPKPDLEIFSHGSSKNPKKMERCEKYVSDSLTSRKKIVEGFENNWRESTQEKRKFEHRSTTDITKRMKSNQDAVKDKTILLSTEDMASSSRLNSSEASKLQKYGGCTGTNLAVRATALSLPVVC